VHEQVSLLTLGLLVVKTILHRRWIWNAVKRQLRTARENHPGRRGDIASRRMLAYERVRIDDRER
jgi:hypothetical protein